MGLNGWNQNQKLKLVIDSSKVDEDLINFPVNITLSSGTGQTGFDATVVFDELSTVSGTKKIAVTDSDDNQLYVEIERWNWGSEEASLWVKVPTVSSGTNTELFLYYDSDHADNTDYVGDTDDVVAELIWDSHFKAVYHMQDDTTSTIKDSTSNDNDGTKVVDGYPTSVTGKIGLGQSYDGNQRYIGAGNPESLQLGTTGTIEAIIQLTDSGHDNIVSKGNLNTNRDGYNFHIYTGKLICELADESDCNQLWSDTIINDGNYHTVTFTWGSTLIAYKDGSSDCTPIARTLVPAPGINDFYIGMDIHRSDFGFTGVLDEIRVSDIERPVAWIKATHYSNWDELIVYESGESVFFTFSNSVPAHLSTVYGTTEQLYLTTTVSGDDPDYVYDVTFHDSFDVQIGTTVSGISSGDQAASNTYFSTPSGIDYSWYVIATSSGSEDTSSTYTFHNRFLASGTTKVDGTLASGIDVRLYRRDTGELVGDSISTVSGIFDIETQYDIESYCVALSPYTDTNSLIYDFLEFGD